MTEHVRECVKDNWLSCMGIDWVAVQFKIASLTHAQNTPPFSTSAIVILTGVACLYLQIPLLLAMNPSVCSRVGECQACSTLIWVRDWVEHLGQAMD